MTHLNEAREAQLISSIHALTDIAELPAPARRAALPEAIRAALKLAELDAGTLRKNESNDRTD